MCARRPRSTPRCRSSWGRAMERIGLVGIGAMGSGIAENLLKAGHPVWAFHRPTPSGKAAAEKLSALGAETCVDLGEVFSKADVLAICLPRSEDVESIILGPGGLAEARGTTVRTVLDFSTAHPDSTRKLHSLLKGKGVDFLDIPMTGSVREAKQGTLNLIAGGEEGVFRRVEPLLRKISALALYAGPSGSGNLVKLANNLLAILDQAVTARISIELDRNGISPNVYTEFLGKSSANSGGFRLMMYRIMSGDFARKFELSLALKDIGYCRDVFPSPFAEELHSFLTKASEAGYGDKDIGAMYHYLKENS